jgi:hypothetical protein
MTPEVTKPQAIKPLTEDITLPERPDGTAFVFRVRALVGAGIMAAQEAATIMTGQRSRKPTPEQLAALDRSFRRIAEAGIVEPKLVYEGEGSPSWDDLTVIEQTTIIKAIYRLSGVGQSKDKGVANAAARFPSEPRRGKKDRANSGARVPDGAQPGGTTRAQAH